MRRLAVGLTVALAACSTGPDQGEVVTAVADEALVPLVGDAATELEGLAAAVGQLCSNEDGAALDAAQLAWRSAKEAWERSEVTVFYGPAPMLRTESKVDFEPVSPEGIEELLASDTILDVDYVDNRSSASRRGLGTIEYLIFAPGGPDARQCELANSAGIVAANAAAEMEEAWVGGTDPFRDVFTSTMEPNAAFADVVGAQYEIVNRQTLFELGVALGVTAPEADPQAIPEGPAEAGVDRYLAQLEGIDLSLRAGGETSLLELIRSRSGEVADQIEQRLESAVSQLGTIDGPMRQAVIDQPELMNSILEDLSALRDLVHVDVVSLLDLTLGFSDSDGDSG